MFAREIERICDVCGKPYIAKAAGQVVCSEECYKIRVKEKQHQRYLAKKALKKLQDAYADGKMTVVEEDISTAVENANRMGLTYGQYVTKQYFEHKK